MKLGSTFVFRGTADEIGIDKSSSMFGISRLHSTASKRNPRSSATNGTVSSTTSSKIADAVAPPTIVKEGKEKVATVLRKRTTSAPAQPASVISASSNGAVSSLKEGESVLAQIGEPDHSGWMRKRGDRYNSWKLRYFVLKGQHLYWLKSSSTAVRTLCLPISYIVLIPPCASAGNQD